MGVPCLRRFGGEVQLHGDVEVLLGEAAVLVGEIVEGGCLEGGEEVVEVVPVVAGAGQVGEVLQHRDESVVVVVREVAGAVVGEGDAGRLLVVDVEDDGGDGVVAELLRAEGFDTDEAPPGADGGIDITAGRGLLGLESPKLIVQVKTPQIGSEVVAQLNGLVHTHGADYGLLATWAGLSKPARDAVKHQRFRVKVWDSTDIVEAVLRNYEKLPESITERLPLRRVWMLKES